MTVRPVQSPSRHGPRRQAGSFYILQLVRKPIKTLVETVSARGARGLDVPVTMSQAVQAQLVCDLSSIHGIGQVLEAHKQTISNRLH